MRTQLINLIVLALVIFSCATKNGNDVNDDASRIFVDADNAHKNDVVLINAGDIDRCGIGELVRSLSKCRPRLIGINLLFIDEKDMKCDTILISAIRDAANVVLAEGYRDEKFITSNIKFTDVAFLTGLSGISQNEKNETASYFRVSDDRGKLELSFPFHLALQFDKRRPPNFSATVVSPKDYPIKLYQSLEEFVLLDYKTDFSKNCAAIENKIVIIGYLGPEKEDIFLTRASDNSVSNQYGTVILANAVMDILKEFDSLN